MSLKKAIENGKEHRRPVIKKRPWQYRIPGQTEYGKRHCPCEWCQEKDKRLRMFRHRRLRIRIAAEMADYHDSLKEQPTMRSGINGERRKRQREGTLWKMSF